MKIVPYICKNPLLSEYQNSLLDLIDYIESNPGSSEAQLSLVFLRTKTWVRNRLLRYSIFERNKRGMTYGYFVNIKEGRCPAYVLEHLDRKRYYTV